MNAKHSMTPRVDIALASYNGASFLSGFLDSLLALDYQDFRLVVSDDNSADDTLSIVGKYTDRLCVVTTSNKGKRGVASNFSNALARTEARYVALADQDDHWHPEKLTRLLAAAEAIECSVGRDFPVLVFSDLEVVDAKLETIKPSFYDSYAKSRDARTLEDFVGGNHIPGCTMLLNRAALDVALPMPPAVQLHDWWLALVVSIFGIIDHVPHQLVKYRQHEQNCYGAPPSKSSQVSLRRMVSYVRHPRARLDALVEGAGPHAASITSNAKALLERYDDALSDAQRRLLRDVVAANPLRRARALFAGKPADSVRFRLATVAALDEARKMAPTTHR